MLRFFRSCCGSKSSEEIASRSSSRANSLASTTVKSTSMLAIDQSVVLSSSQGWRLFDIVDSFSSGDGIEQRVMTGNSFIVHLPEEGSVESVCAEAVDNGSLKNIDVSDPLALLLLLGLRPRDVQEIKETAQIAQSPKKIVASEDEPDRIRIDAPLPPLPKVGEIIEEKSVEKSGMRQHLERIAEKLGVTLNLRTVTNKGTREYEVELGFLKVKIKRIVEEQACREMIFFLRIYLRKQGALEKLYYPGKRVKMTEKVGKNPLGEIMRESIFEADEQRLRTRSEKVVDQSGQPLKVGHQKYVNLLFKAETKEIPGEELVDAYGASCYGGGILVADDFGSTKDEAVDRVKSKAATRLQNISKNLSLTQQIQFDLAFTLLKDILVNPQNKKYYIRCKNGELPQVGQANDDFRRNSISSNTMLDASFPRGGPSFIILRDCNYAEYTREYQKCEAQYVSDPDGFARAKQKFAAVYSRTLVDGVQDTFKQLESVAQKIADNLNQQMKLKSLQQVFDYLQKLYGRTSKDCESSKGWPKIDIQEVLKMEELSERERKMLEIMSQQSSSVMELPDRKPLSVASP